MINTKFLTIRKCYGFDWEAYRDTRTDVYIAICHTFSKSVESDSWEDLWEKILEASKARRKEERQKRKRKKPIYI
tara:strand:- start:181 stop:405 length:225 start_codon:yes stop_codon:yes gene_type:complete